MRLMPLATAILASAALVSPATAHHSFAMYDLQKVVTLNGVVREFRWVNPHSSLVMEVNRPGAAAEVWVIEMTSPGNLTRFGWTRKSFNSGDRVQIEIVPLRNGKHGGGFRKATLLDTGQVLSGSLTDAEKRN